MNHITLKSYASEVDKFIPLTFNIECIMMISPTYTFDRQTKVIQSERGNIRLTDGTNYTVEETRVEILQLLDQLERSKAENK